MQIAVRTFLREESTVMMDTHLGVLVQDFVDEQRQRLKINANQQQRLSLAARPCGKEWH